MLDREDELARSGPATGGASTVLIWPLIRSKGAAPVWR